MIGISCDNDGRCKCKPNFDGIRCDKCRDGFYNYPICEECNFDPAGVAPTFKNCSLLKPGELVSCKPRVTGRICNECKELYWNLQVKNPDGCDDCSCSTEGTIGKIGSCDPKTGQCVCKAFVTSRECNKCKNGFYDLTNKNLYGCEDCGCDIGGSISNTCDKISGQCLCQPRITGKTCRDPLQTHYFPTLHQYQYEAEDGRTPAYTAVRYGFDEQVFPGYSWRGYAVYSQLQNETVHSVVIDKPSVYRIIFRYINTNEQTILGTVSAMPEDFNNIEPEQKFQVQFKPTRIPTFVTAAGIAGNSPSPFVLNPGPWLFKVTSQSGLFLDYFVLMPAAYYEADLLVYNVMTPCSVDGYGLCRHYQYPTVTQFDQVHGEGAYVSEGDSREEVKEYFDDVRYLEILGTPRMPVISETQPKLYFDLRVTKPEPHALLISYITAMSNTDVMILELEASSHSRQEKSRLTLYPCRYTASCKEVALDREGKVAIFDFDTNFISLILKGDESKNIVGIEVLIAIPKETWSLNYIQPQPMCVRKDSKCVQSRFLTPPDSKRFDFKSGNEYHIAKVFPSTIYDNTTAELIYLDHEDAMVDVSGKVPNPGHYIFAVHYYQPDHPEFDMDVLVHNGQTYEGKLPVQHCPSNSGCRSVVRQHDGNMLFLLNENFLLTLKEPNHKSIWLHYILVIPNEVYTEDLIQEQPFDQTTLFLSECGKNSFYLNVSEPGFCRDATFSLTTRYNHGALPCHCDFDGSYSLECNKFGGQCFCRENVIGRRCDSCKTGYFGFPNCRSCDCPSTAFCDPTTGACICPPNVMGEKCNQCKPYTFGYHPIIGCEDCNCNRYGVLNENLQCDLHNGSCTCKQYIEGRACDRCIAGHWYFPQCIPCQCDERGTTPEICNQTSSGCFCKENVDGIACDICKDGTFNLQPDNEEGCTKCFCFGKTTRCISSTLFRTEVSSGTDWKLVNLNVLAKSVEITPLELKPESTGREISVDMTLILNRVTYFVAPSAYLGNKLTSYGGFLNYTILYSGNQYGSPVSGADVILYGSNTYLLYNSIEQPASDIHFLASLQIIESSFVTLSNSPVTREQLMVTLQNLTAVYIRAHYWDQSLTVKLIGVTLEIAVPEYSEYSSIALSVEQCQCPPNYIGLSCEECANGYYRASAGPSRGYCIPCQCNGHAATCDKVTGICHNCKHSTKGDHCEKCEVGFYGNATVGTPHDCLICACPLPVPSNNFATSCEISEHGYPVHCDCIPGYTGSRCESCAAGHYGRPDVTGEKCVPCQCNDNIDASDPESCDPVSGKCLKCSNNTYDDSCSICAPGYYGDAIIDKNCQSCDCDKCGTSYCDHMTGECHCHPNVIGEKCDRCADHHFGFSTCSGCTPCNCALASESSQCDDDTGQCRCKGGVAGRTCDRCAAGYWQYSEYGCTSCGCNTGYSIGVGCNPVTGLCECLRGVIGDKCDMCPHRWVLLPNEGCLECDTCTHSLLDVTDRMKEAFQPTVNQFQTVSVGYFTSQRLIFINNTVNDLRPNVTDVLAYQFDLSPFVDKIERLSKDSSAIQREAKGLLSDAIEAAKKGELTYKDALDIQVLINKVIEGSKATVYEMNNLAYSLETGAGPQTDYALNEGKRILEDVRNFEKEKEKEKELKDALEEGTVVDVANNMLEKAKDFAKPLEVSKKELASLRGKVENVNNKLDEIQNFTEMAQRTAAETVALSETNKKVKISERIGSLENSVKEENVTIFNAANVTVEASINLENSKHIFEQLKENLKNMKDLKSKTDQVISQNDEKLKTLKTNIRDAHDHAVGLANQASTLDSLIRDSRIESETAVQAATSYKNIVKAVLEAIVAANDANNAAQNASEKSNGIREKVKESQDKSAALLEQAKLALHSVQQSLSPELLGGIQQVNAVVKMNKLISDIIQEIEQIISTIKPIREKRSPQKLNELNADEVSDNALNTLYSIQNVTQDLPENLRRANQLHKDEEDKMKFISQGSSHLSRVEKQQPDIADVVFRLKERPEKIKQITDSVKQMLDDLKSKISSSRDLVDKIKVGITIMPQTWMELRVPANIESQETSSYVSLYFKTEVTHGLIFYLGNEMGTSKKLRKVNSDDFLALTVDNGYLELIIDLGSGPTRIKNDQYIVSTNRWYKVIIQRTGKTVRLTLLDELGKDFDYRMVPYVKEFILDGIHSVLNLQKESKLFIGGVPSSFDVQPDVRYNSFEGQIEEFVIGDTAVGLWNYIEVGSSKEQMDTSEILRGAKERDRFIRKISSTGCRFNGAGYVMISSRGFDLDKKSDIVLRFKSSSFDGLLFLAFRDSAFISIELRDGYILYQYDVGSGLMTMYSPEQYNDNQWHTIETVRVGDRGELKVDGVIKQTTPVRSVKPSELRTPEYLFIGGYSGEHQVSEVTKTPFDGCIDQVQIDGISVDLNKNVNARGITIGCPDKFSSIVSFEEGSHGYAHWSNSTEMNNYYLELTFKFKTKNSNGMLAYGVDGAVSFILLLTNGVLIFKSGGREVYSSPNFHYNDNQWHAVMVVHNEEQLQLIVDDFDIFQSSGPPSTIRLLYATLYFGSVPSSLDAAAAIEKQFVGCIADATLNGIIINFAELTDTPAATVGRCTDPPQKAVYQPSQKPEEPVTRPGPTYISTVYPNHTTTHKVTTISAPIGLCALPLYPAKDPDVTDQGGSRFGTAKNSGLVYNFDLAQGSKKRYEFSIEIKTISDEGVVFYAGSKTDYIALYLHEGKIHFVFGNKLPTTISSGSVNILDGEWHMVEFSVNQKYAKLSVDSSSDQQTIDIPNKLNIEPPYFLGAVESDTLARITPYLQGMINITFEGCTRNFKVNNNLVGDASKVINVIPCSQKVESGVFYPPDGGYIKAREKFRVGRYADIKLDIKPRNIDGLLISVHAGRKDYLVLQMINGSVKFTVDSGNGPVSTAYTPQSPYYFCDGQWHTIEVVKSKNVVVVRVDKQTSPPGIDRGAQLTADTNHPLYIGGHPSQSKLRGVEVSASYVGCIRNVEVNGLLETSASFVEYSNVVLSICPTI